GAGGWGRVKQCWDILQSIAKRSEEDDIAFVLFCGDLFHDKKPSLDVFESTMAIMATESFRAKDWYFVAGQHDWREEPYGASNYDFFRKIWTANNDVYENFFSVSTKRKYWKHYYSADDFIIIVAIPYGKEAAEALIDVRDLQIERATNYILAIHTPIRGYPIHGNYISKEGLTTKQLSDGPWKYVAAGDFHEHKISYYKDTKIVMTGSTIQNTFGESVGGHGYCIVDLETFHVDRVVCDYDKMITIEVGAGTNEATLNNILDMFINPNTIFRFIVEDKSTIPLVETCWDTWKNRTNSNNGYQVQLKYKNNICLEKGAIEESRFNIRNEIKEYINNLNLTKMDAKNIIQLGEELCDKAGV
ncbi:MAG: metallophosphoesterase family protein, partial [Candidatus Odinarchaeia archaeon]